MTIYGFLKECSELWVGKELTPKQEEFYGLKLSRFSDKEIGKIFEWLTENCKFFPKIADIFEAARHCGFMDRVKEYKPHTWTPTDCRLCGGSGQLSAFYEQLFDPINAKRYLELRKVMQFESSVPTARDHEWTHYYFRCSCPAGEAPTLESGLPRWDTSKPERLEFAL